MRPSTTIATFVAVACVGLTAACTSSSSDPGPTFTPPHTTVPVTSPVSTSGPSRTTTPPPTRPTVPADVPRTGPNTRKGEQPPVMPLAATQHSPDGAKAFAEFFIKTIDWGYATTSSAYMRHYFSHACTTCLSVANGFDTAHAQGQHFLGGRFTLGASYLRSGGTDYVAAVPFAISAFELLSRAGKISRADGAHSHERFDVTTNWSRGAWRATQVAVET